MELSRAALHQALGPEGMPATLTFTFTALIVATPGGNIRIPARTVLTAASGAHSAGLRPCDADVLREATDGPDSTISLAADALTLTLTHAGSTVRTGRW
jgi:hypothetical protein